MARRHGSAASASARRCKIPLSMLQHELHNLPHSSKHVDVGRPEAGWAAAECAFGPACAAHLRRHVVARRGRGKKDWQHGRLIGQDAMVPWWAVARWSWCGRVRDAGTMRGRWRGPVAAERGLHAVLGGGSHCPVARTGFWRQMVPRLRGGELPPERHLSRSGLFGPRARLRGPAFLVGPGGEVAVRGGPLAPCLRTPPGLMADRTFDCGTMAAPRVALPGGRLRRCPLTQGRGASLLTALGRDRLC